MAGREQLPLRQMEGFGAGLVLTGARKTLGFCLPSRSAPSPSMGDIPADPLTMEPPRSESPSPSEEERDPSEPATAPQSPRVPPLLPEAASEIPADTGSEEQPSDHPDGESSSSWGEQRVSLATLQAEGSMEQGQEFPLLEVSGSGVVSNTMYGLGLPGCHRTCLSMGLSDPAALMDSHGLRAPCIAVGAVGVLAGESLCQL